MKRIILFIMFFVFYFTGYLFAVPASPDFAEIKQPDGKTFKARLKGDEFYHWYESEDGYTIIKDTSTKFWKYAKKHKFGHLEKSEYIAGKDIPVDIRKGLKDEEMLLKAANNRHQTEMQNRASDLKQKEFINRAASFGSNNKSVVVNEKNLVILVEFADKKFTFLPEQINDLYNQKNYTYDGAVGSVKDYFDEISYNNFDMEFIVSTFVVTLDKSYVYYGENDSSGSDKHPREMVEEAIAKLDEAGFNFAQADGNGDGWVDILTVVHAGCGEEYTGADSNDIWSHQWSIHSVYTTKDNKKISKYIAVPERRGSENSKVGLVRIGVIAHELLHIFGIPDLYDTTYKSKGLGSFCLMAHGLWNGDSGSVPAHPCAWVKYKLGFIEEPQGLSKGKNSIGISANSKDAFYKISPDNFSYGEYFMIENRQPYGFDKSLPGSTSGKRGLLIYHIDEKKANNNDRTHYKVALEEADAKTSDWTMFDLAQNRNNGTDTDYFRDTTLTTFSDNNINAPNSLSYTYQKSDINIFNISASGDIMYFWTESYDDFVDNLDENRGVIMVNTVMGFSKTKSELKLLDEAAQKEMSEYFTFTVEGAEEANNMYDIYKEYNENETVFAIPKNKMSVLTAANANLVNRLNYALRTSSGTQTIKSVGVISFADDAPVENNNVSSGQNMRFTGTEVLEEISYLLNEYGYLMPKFNTMQIN